MKLLNDSAFETNRNPLTNVPERHRMPDTVHVDTILSDDQLHVDVLRRILPPSSHQCCIRRAEEFRRLLHPRMG